MADRTPIEVLVFACPDEDAGTVLDVLHEHGLLPQSPRTGLELCRGYMQAEMPVGSSEEIAAALPRSSAWQVWEDPKYEHLGQVFLHHPDLGVFRADCDAYGRAVFSGDEVDQMVSETGGDRVALGHLTGRTWQVALEALRSANEGIVVQPGTAGTSSRMQAAALNQLTGGPARWLPPNAPGLARTGSAPTL
ncbi:DUF3145 family protein [Nocardioides lacusdianchii]|uniref:DUF3145 family protein n=1 Tax=Nocardioides lacusdianchii TaxID=2783664 RepID=UPI001CCE9857|nr:DUF3145 family protein [Nocardioides lacusdianchii]